MNNNSQVTVEQSWVCPRCGRPNRSTSKFCASCGASFVAPAPRKSKTPKIIAIVIACILAAGAIGFGVYSFVLKDRGEENQTAAESQNENAATEENPNAAVGENPNAAEETTAADEPENTKALKVKATSVREAMGENTYEAEHLIDGNYSTTWVEGAAGRGEGESVTVYFENKHPIKAIRIANGYQKSEKAYSENNRVKGIELSFDDGKKYTCDLLDHKNGDQMVLLPEGADSNSFTLKITSVYTGSVDDYDSCISELGIVDPAKIDSFDGPRVYAD